MSVQIVYAERGHVSLFSKPIYNVNHRMDAQNGQSYCPISHDRKTLSRFSSSSAVRSGWFTNITFRANPFPTEVTVQGPPKFFHARKSAFPRTKQIRDLCSRLRPHLRAASRRSLMSIDGFPKGTEPRSRARQQP